MSETSGQWNPLYRVERAGNVVSVCGDSVTGLLKAVAEQLREEETFGEGYDLRTLARNLDNINEDARAGRIVAPRTTEQYVTAILEDYRENIAAIPPDVLKQLSRAGVKRDTK